MPQPNYNQIAMEHHVHRFLSAKTYTAQHTRVMLMALVEGKEDIEMTLSPLNIARFYAKMQVFGFKHGMNDPHCNCLGS